jgi:hypothetical protein
MLLKHILKKMDKWYLENIERHFRLNKEKITEEKAKKDYY